MPKGFTGEEKERIREKLLEAARKYLEKYGIRRTNVEDITRETGIAKGSFYLFYDSKEELFFDVFERLEKDLRGKLFAEISQSGLSPREKIRRLIRFTFDVMTDNPYLKIVIDRAEIEAFVRKLPPEKIDAHIMNDTGAFLELVRHWQDEGIMKPYDSETVAGLLRSLFFMNMYRDEIGAEVFPKITELLADLLSGSLAEKGGSHDKS